MKEESILFLPVMCTPRREGRGRRGESSKDKEKGGGGIRARVSNNIQFSHEIV